MNVPAITAALLCSLGGAQQDPLDRIFQHASEVKRQQLEKPRRGINFSFQELRLLNQPLCLHLHWGFDLAEGETASDVLEDKYVLQEADGSQASHPATRRYHYAAQPLAVTTGAVTSWLNVDAQGSVTDATSTTGSITTARQYDAWGQYRNGTAPTPLEPKLGYTGHQFDVETGLVYARARYYDPALGIFLSRDSLEGITSDAPSLHRFNYVRNNPLRYTDPSGLCWYTSDDNACPSFGDLLTGGERPASTTISPRAPPSLEEFDPNLEQYSESAKLRKQWFASMDPSVVPVAGDAMDIREAEEARLNRIEIQRTGRAFKEGAKVVVEASAVYLGGEVLAVGAGVLAPTLARVGARTVGVEFEGGAIISQAARTERLVGNLAASRSASATSRFAEFAQQERALAQGELLSGSGPARGVIEVSERAKSAKAFLNYTPRQGAVEFVFDPASNTFLTGKARLDPATSPHQQLAKLAGADQGTVVGGMFSRGPRGEFQTNEFSGHYGQNWTPAVRDQFSETIKRLTGAQVGHTPW